jgi:formylglycine-generating enzyme required for sulfatase activity
VALLLVSAACGRVDRRVASPDPIVLEMVPVSDATFTMGAGDGDDDERPVHEEHVAAFTIGRTEVTVADYRHCETAGACTATPPKPYCNEGIDGRARHPINCVTWAQAAAFCSWAGARLPTEREWEYASRGLDGRRYPWGNTQPSDQLCWDGPGSDLGLGRRRGTCPVGSYRGGASPFGALDMAGNVWEWTADFYANDHASQSSEELQVTRGGTWFTYDARDVRASLRSLVRPGAKNYGIGFRCARTVRT